jgi:hypothetical protein
MSTAPMPVSEASVSNVKGSEKTGKARTGADDIASFNIEKATECWGDHMKESFFNRSCKGLQMRL